LVSLTNFRTYFFPLGEVNASFSYLLTRANNYRRFLSGFFKQKNHLALSISMQKYAENRSFYVLKVKKIGHKIVTLSAPNILDPLLTLNMHLIINNALLWDQKGLYWRDSEIIKGAGLVLRPTTVHWGIILAKGQLTTIHYMTLLQGPPKDPVLPTLIYVPLKRGNKTTQDWDKKHAVDDAF
jgi:hypothetical protein